MAKAGLLFVFSYYGICAGKSDGCLKLQTSMAKLVGELEANALAGGMLQGFDVLAAAPEPTVESVAVAVPPCYCSSAFNISKIFDTYTTLALGDENTTAPHDTDEPTAIITGFMSTSGMCLSDDCKVKRGPRREG